MAGYWFVPSGFMELYERPEDAAARELSEETGLRLNPDSLDFFLVGSIPDISEVYLAYRAEVDSAEVSTVKITDESLDVGFFSFEEAPLKNSAFPIAEETFRCLYRDLAAGRRTAYCAHIFKGEHILRPIEGL
jgi:ADP-ribose pyrophosphatase YjhB (NUDIX family)